MRLSKTTEDRVLDTFVTVMLSFIGFITLYPLVYVFSMSISDPSAVISGRVILWPVGFSLESYRKVVSYAAFWLGYQNTVIYTVLGSAISVICTVMCGYAISRKHFVLKKFVSYIMLTTMLFSGGVVPGFIIINNLGMYNTRWAIVLPGAVGAFNLIITRVFFQQNIPESIEESAKIDGANDLKILLKIIVPLSTTIIAILTLFTAVGHWNSYFPALLYLRNEKLRPVQLVLRDIALRNSTTGLFAQDETMIAQQMQFMVQIKYVTIFLTLLPILMLYPFLQKYFVKGVMIGAVKE